MTLENLNIKDVEDKNNLSSTDEIDPLFKESFAAIRKIVNSPQTENQDQEETTEAPQEKLKQEKEGANTFDDPDSSELSEDDFTDESELDSNSESEKTPKKKKKLWQIKSQYYAEKQKRSLLEQQLRELEAQKRTSDEMLQESLRLGLDQLSNNAGAELSLAKEKHRKAVLDNDVNAFTEASVEIALATAKLNDIRNRQSNNYYNSPAAPPPPQYQPAYNQYQNQYQEQYQGQYGYHHNPYDPNPYQPYQEYPQYQQQQELTAAQEKGRDWASEHPYLQPGSKAFDPILYKKVSNYMDEYNEEIAREGRQHEWFSDQYCKKMDRYIAKQRGVPDRIARNIESVSSVGGVRNHSTSRTKANNELTPEEKEMAENFGISESLYRKYKDNR